jgi:hypothetical protein
MSADYRQFIAPQNAVQVHPRRMQVTKAFGTTQLIVSGATATMLAIGRFAALPYQRKIAEKQVPMQNGETHLAAGDAYAPSMSHSLCSSPFELFASSIMCTHLQRWKRSGRKAEGETAPLRRGSKAEKCV